MTRPVSASAQRDTARVVGWALVFYGAAQLAGAFFAPNKVGSAAVQAVLAEWGAGRIGVTWSDPLAPAPPWTAMARRAARGAAYGALAALWVLAFALTTRAATFQTSPPSFAQLALGLLMAALIAARDELFLRGYVLRAVAGARPWVGLAACALAGVAARFGAGEGALVPLVNAGLAGILLACAWQVDRGAWMAWGAHVAWVWLTGSVVRGGLVDVRSTLGRWGGGDAGLEGSLAALVALSVLTVGVVARTLRARSPRLP